MEMTLSTNQQAVHLRDDALAEVGCIIDAQASARLLLVADEAAYAASGAASVFDACCADTRHPTYAPGAPTGE